MFSKHFRSKDMNQSNFLRDQLTPNADNILVRLNVDAVPNVHCDD